MAVIALAKAGYGSVDEIDQWDTPKFLDVLEFENIQRTIEAHLIEEARNGSK